MDFVEYLEGLDGLRYARRYAMTIILLIQEMMDRDEIVYGQKIHDIVGGGKKTIFDRIQELELHGFITKQVIDNVYPRVIALQLTDQGHRVADILRMLRDINLDR
jgi:DNA-binding HxlR family transcriptional regulator